MGMRLDRYLSELGIASRSELKKMITAGRVRINSAIANRPEHKVDIDRDRVFLDGRELGLNVYDYFLLNKPKGCISATEDSKHRTVLDFIDEKRKGLAPVGRLDIDTEGLLLITNDGELAHRLLSPNRHVDKRYYFEAKGRLHDNAARLCAEGIELEEGFITRPALLEVDENVEGICRGCITIHEGRFHQVKRMIKAVGAEVIYLKRLSMGPLVLDESELKPGEYRRLTEEELKELKTI